MATKQLAKRVKCGIVVPDTKRDSEAMQKVFRLSLVELEAVLDGKMGMSDRTKVAANTLTNYSRIKSTEIHDKALEMMLAKRITGG